MANTVDFEIKLKNSFSGAANTIGDSAKKLTESLTALQEQISRQQVGTLDLSAVTAEFRKNSGDLSKSVAGAVKSLEQLAQAGKANLGQLSNQFDDAAPKVSRGTRQIRLSLKQLRDIASRQAADVPLLTRWKQSFLEARSLGGLAGSSFGGFRAVASAAFDGAGKGFDKLAKQGRKNLSELGTDITKWGSLAAATAASVAGAFSVSAARSADDVADLGEALTLFTGSADAGDRVRAIAREFATPVAETQRVFIDLAASNIRGGQAEEIFARLQDLGALGVDKSRTDSLETAFKKISADDRLDIGDLKALQTGGVNKPAFFAALATNLGKSLPEIESLVKQGSIKSDAAIRAALDVIKNNTGNRAAGAQAKGDLASTIAGQTQALRSSFEQFQLNFGQGLVTSLTPALPLITELATRLGGLGGQELAGKLSGGIGKVLTFLIENFDSIVAGIGAIVDGASAGFAIVGSLFSAIFGSANGNTGDTLRNIGEVIGSLLNVAIPLLAVIIPLVKVVGLISTGIAAAAGAISTITTIAGAVSSAAGVVAGFIGAIVSLPVIIGAAVIAGLSLIWVFRDEIASVFSSIWQTMVSIGDMLIKGLVSGILGGANAVKDALIGVGRSALDGFKSLFGIASPSKVMGEMGKFTVQGFAQGVDRGEGDVTSAMATTFSPPSLPFAAPAPVASGGSSVGVNAPVTIIVEGSGDPKATASAVADKLAKTLSNNASAAFAI